MPLFRRRPPDPSIERARAGFAPVAVAVEAAQRALLAAIPTSRDPGVPLGQALAAFGSHLDAAGRALDGWDEPIIAAERGRCSAAIAAARAEAERLRLEAGPLGFERLNARVGDVLHPLEEVAEVERTLRRR